MKHMQKNKTGFRENVLDMRRVTRVVAGGKRFRFRATIILGNEKGKVGVGMGKGIDVQQSIEKARTDAKKKMITIPLEGTTIPHEVQAKFSAAIVLVKPASRGHGLKAGGAVRQVLLLAGVRDATAKCLSRTKNKLTNALATLEALRELRSSKKRGVKEAVIQAESAEDEEDSGNE